LLEKIKQLFSAKIKLVKPTYLFLVFGVDCGDAEPHWLELLNDPRPDGLDPEAGEAPVGVEKD
jgi:hypothetical protein